MRNFLCILATLLFLMPSRAKAEPGREFIMSATYGVLAGTLVGAATLAFTDKPGDNLKNIARGASYGLYAGILLGLYVAYGIPGEGDDVPPAYEQPGVAPDDDNYSPEDRSTNPEEPIGPAGKISPPHFTSPAFVPLISERGFEGAGVQIQYLF